MTFYFTQKLLTQYETTESENEDVTISRSSLDEEVIAFIQKYGSYLQIHSCLSFSAAVKAEAAIAELLTVASYDPSHRDAIIEIKKANTLTFYDSVSHFRLRNSIEALSNPFFWFVVDKTICRVKAPAWCSV